MLQQRSKWLYYFHRIEFTFPPISDLKFTLTLIAWRRERNARISLLFLCLILNNPFASWNANLKILVSLWGAVCVCVWLRDVFVSLSFLGLLELEGRGRRLVKKKGWHWGNGVWTCVNNEGCRLFLWLKIERLISFRAQHTPPEVLITVLQRGSAIFL